MESNLREYSSPQMRNFGVFLLPTLVTPTIRSIKCKQSPVYGVFDRYFHIPLPIIKKHELGLPFALRNLRINFGANPSTIFLLIVVTDRQAHKSTPVNNIFPCFCRENKSLGARIISQTNAFSVTAVHTCPCGPVVKAHSRHVQ